MADLKDLLLTKVVPSALTGVGTVALAAWRTLARLAALELGAKAFFEKHGTEYAKLVLKDIEDLTKALKDLKDELEKDRTSFTKEVASRVKSKVTERRLVARITEKHNALEARVDLIESALAELRSSLVKFSAEQDEQWQEMNRTLGQIEGFLRAMSGKFDT